MKAWQNCSMSAGAKCLLSAKKYSQYLSKVVLIQVIFLAILLSLEVHAAPLSRTKSTASVSKDSMFILEPYVGYERGYLTQNGIPDITTSGVGYGARLGMRYSGIGFGLDYFIGSESASQQGQTSDFKPTEYGFFIGFKLSSSWRLYGSYLLSAKAKIQSNSNQEDFSGSGYKLGVGWSLYPMMDINLELYNRIYNKYGGSSLSNSLLSSTAGLSLSFPLF